MQGLNYPSFFDDTQKPLHFFHEGFEIEKTTKGLPSKRSSKNVSIAKHIINLSIEENRKHNLIRGAFSLHSEHDFRKWVSSRSVNQLKKFLFDKNIIEVYEESNLNEFTGQLESRQPYSAAGIDGFTKGYFLTHKTKEALEDFFDEFQIEPSKISTPDLNEGAIREKRSDGLDRESSIQIPRWIKIDVERMKKSIDECPQRDRLLLQMIWGTAMSQNGFLKQEYYEKHPWPRLFGVGHLQSLQLIPTRLLPYIIPNTFEYDVQASVFTIASQMAKKRDASIKTPMIDKYIEERKEIRARIASELGASEDEIKRCFTAIGYGAKTENPYFSTLNEILWIRTRVDQFLNDSFVQPFIQELKRCREIILENQVRAGFKLKKRQQFALQIQMVEVMMLQEMVRFAQQENIGIKAIKHDAILLDEKIDHRDMEDHVKNVMSLNIRIDEERIE